jgi:quercetin dioxygenase-like cupin family protein
MTGDIRELLPLYSLGILDADEVKQVDRAIAADPALAAELASFHDAVDALIAPETPSPDVKARLMASVGGGRFERYAKRIAEIYDVTIERGRELLGLIERAASWEVRAPGIGLVHFEGGPAVATADCGFIRIDPKMIFPWHTHVGVELSIVLVGTLEDNAGRILRPGDELLQQPGTEHAIRAQDEEVIFATRAFEGITISGVRQR